MSSLPFLMILILTLNYTLFGLKLASHNLQKIGVKSSKTPASCIYKKHYHSKVEKVDKKTQSVILKIMTKNYDKRNNLIF